MISIRHSLLIAIFCLVSAAGQQPAARPGSQARPTHDVVGGDAVHQQIADSSCLPCHQSDVDAYAHTAHHLTSQPASKSSILGSFKAGSNILMISDPNTAEDAPGLLFKMEARSNGYYQTAVSGLPGVLQRRSERIDVVIGAGTRGQSYLYWQGDRLYELPVSYWSDGKQWINSPGYANGSMNFSRPITPRCLECHASFIQALSTDPLANVYSKNTLIPGISCQICHGSGAAHIAGHRSQPHVDTTVDDILNPSKLSRDRQIDLCALCHNGIRQQEIAPAFSFKPGQTLDGYVVPDPNVPETLPNVHGDQVGLLKQSLCYRSSPSMSCSTCHDVHAQEKAAASYSTRCLACHRAAACGMFKTKGPSIANDCIDCHMPVQATNAIFSNTAGRAIQAKMRTHWIKAYP